MWKIGSDVGLINIGACDGFNIFLVARSLFIINFNRETPHYDNELYEQFSDLQENFSDL